MFHRLIQPQKLLAALLTKRRTICSLRLTSGLHTAAVQSSTLLPIASDCCNCHGHVIDENLNLTISIGK
jgi:hypothetical protein